MKKILFATDGSDNSKRTAEFTRQLLEAWPNAELNVLYVSRLIALPAAVSYGGMAYSVEPAEAIQKYEQSIAEHIRDQVTNDFLGVIERVRFVHKTGSRTSRTSTSLSLAVTV